MASTKNLRRVKRMQEALIKINGPKQRFNTTTTD